MKNKYLCPKIDNSALKTFKIVIADFKIKNKIGKL